MKRVAITGGIGSGKSTLCRVLAERHAIAIYDSDQRAKEIMNSDPVVREGIVTLFGSEAYTPEGLNRGHIAARAFADPTLLSQLNGVVHPRVVADFEAWAEGESGDYVIVESALLFSSPLVGHYDLAVVVDAPLELRVERCVARDGLSPEQVRERISRQMSAEEMRLRADIVVVADGRPLVPLADQIDQAIRELKK